MIKIQTKPTKVIDEAEDEGITSNYRITSYGQDFDVEGLVKRIKREDIFVPKFQREFVWNKTQASRFIESLLLGLPVPGVFLSKERESQKLLVIDGQQRLFSLFHFYEGIFADSEREFILTGLRTQFNGKKYKTLFPEDKRRLDDSVIHATIIRQDEPEDGDSSIYSVFERLNTGGTQLQPQEIRGALYHGLFNDLLTSLNSNLSWRELYGPISPRKKDEELILRFFALYFEVENYKRPMKEFLNSYMDRNRNFVLQSKDQLISVFSETVEFIDRYLGSRAFKPETALNAAVYDSLMVGVALRLKKEFIVDKDNFIKRYKELLDNEEYLASTKTGTSSDKNVRTRIQLGIDAFENI